MHSRNTRCSWDLTYVTELEVAFGAQSVGEDEGCGVVLAVHH
jgi:hypothetical protein